MISHLGGKKKEHTHKRSKYVDQTVQFVDWVNGLRLEKTQFGQIITSLDERLRLRRFLLLALFAFSLSVTLFFDFELPTYFQVGSIASVDVKSPLNLEIVDELATEQKRMEAESAVPVVFDYDQAVFEAIIKKIYKAFREMRIEVRRIQWPQLDSERAEIIKDFLVHRDKFEQILGYSVPEYLFEWLVEQKFSARLENLLIGTFERWSEWRIAESPDKNIPKGHQTLVVRSQHDETMIPRSIVRDVSVISDFELSILELRGWNEVNKRDQKNLTKLAHLMLVSNLTPNIKETTLRRQKARKDVLPIVVAVKKNQTIVSQGTVIQQSHLAVLNKIEELKAKQHQDVVAFVTALFLGALVLVFAAYLKRFHGRRIAIDTKDLLVMSVVIFLVVLMTKLFLFILDAAFLSKFGHLLPDSVLLYLAPVAAGPMLIGLLLTSGEVVWLFNLFLAVTLGVMMDLNFSYTIITLIGGITAAYNVHGCKKRNDIYKAGLWTGLIYAIVIGLLLSIKGAGSEKWWYELVWAIPAGFLSGVFSSMIAMMFIPVLESLFNYTTDVRLLELSNLNHPLLKEMLVRAPGTYHHAMIVGSMVEAAAEQINANPLLARVMAYYHDVGKIEHANYFVENQRSGQNPHDQISPYMSKTILIAHTKDGVEIGMRYNLGRPIIDGMLQHHGTSLISFFHNKAVEAQAETKKAIEEADFRYPGPKPQFRESGLLMLADSIEAAARSLEEPNPSRIQNIVKNIIQRKFLDGQLDQCSLTLRDLSIIERSFIRILLSIYHQRIDYKNAGGVSADVAETAESLNKNLRLTNKAENASS